MCAVCVTVSLKGTSAVLPLLPKHRSGFVHTRAWTNLSAYSPTDRATTTVLCVICVLCVLPSICVICVCILCVLHVCIIGGICVVYTYTTYNNNNNQGVICRICMFYVIHVACVLCVCCMCPICMLSVCYMHVRCVCYVCIVYVWCCVCLTESRKMLRKVRWNRMENWVMQLAEKLWQPSDMFSYHRHKHRLVTVLWNCIKRNSEVQ